MWPVTKLAASDASHSTAASRDLVGRAEAAWSGRPCATALMSAILEPSIMGVSTRPGLTALMRMAGAGYSRAADLVSDTTAVFDAE